MLGFLLSTSKGRILLSGSFNLCKAFKKAQEEWEVLPHVFVIDLKGKTYLFRKIGELGCIIWKGEVCHSAITIHAMKQAVTSYPLPACLLAPQGRLLFVNEAMTQLLGYNASQLQKTDFMELFVEPPSHSKTFYLQTYHLKSSYGISIPMMISHVVEEQDFGAVFLAPAELTQSLKPITETLSLNTLPLPSAILDEQGTIIHSNDLFKQKLSFGPSASLNQWIADQDRLLFLQQIQKWRKSSQDTLRTVVHVRNKTTPTFSLFLKTLDDKKGARFLTLFLPEEPLFEGKALDAHKDGDPIKLQLLGQLANGIIHDFNNLLTGILGFCDLLLERHSPEEDSFKDIHQIKQSAMRAARLIQQLLAFSKSSPPSSVPIVLGQCLRDLSPLMHRIVGPKILLSIQEKIDKTSFIHGDMSHLEQILLNLAINARDAMAEGGTLSFEIREVTLKQKQSVVKGILVPKRYIVLDIKDTGTGIPPECVERIFEPFFSTKDPGHGTGLGLSNVVLLMEHFQGGITVNTQMGKGTTFSLYFPEHKKVIPFEPSKSLGPIKSAPVIKKKPFVQPLSGSVRILLVEDEDPVRLFAARALREKGYEVVEARDGTHAMRFLQSHSDMHVVVTDVMMPGVDGPRLAAAMKEMNPLVKILFVSGYPEDEIREQLPPSIQSASFLPKPFALADLINKIQELLS